MWPLKSLRVLINKVPLYLHNYVRDIAIKPMQFFVTVCVEFINWGMLLKACTHAVMFSLLCFC